MALLRNRPVTVIGPVQVQETSPIYTVQYADGTREDTPLKFIQMTDAEFKEFKKTSPNYTDHIRVIDDKEHQEILDKQDVKKIREKQGKTATPAEVPAPQSKTSTIPWKK